jgi:hypothetical protein
MEGSMLSLKSCENLDRNVFAHVIFFFVPLSLDHVVIYHSETGSSGKGGLALAGLSALNMGLAVMMAALGVLTIIEVNRKGFKDFSEPFLACYMVMFAVLLFIYELQWWKAVSHINKSLRKNFGFLYGLRGKGLYLIFVACLCLGLGKDAAVKELNYATGAAFLGGGILHFFIICFHPELAQTYVAPTAGLTSRVVEQPNPV